MNVYFLKIDVWQFWVVWSAILEKKNITIIVLDYNKFEESGCYIWYQSKPNKMLSIGLKKLEIMWFEDSNRF